MRLFYPRHSAQANPLSRPVKPRTIRRSPLYAAYIFLIDDLLLASFQIQKLKVKIQNQYGFAYARCFDFLILTFDLKPNSLYIQLYRTFFPPNIFLNAVTNIKGYVFFYFIGIFTVVKGYAIKHWRAVLHHRHFNMLAANYIRI